jgi:hypothetical protein
LEFQFPYSLHYWNQTMFVLNNALGVSLGGGELYIGGHRSHSRYLVIPEKQCAAVHPLTGDILYFRRLAGKQGRINKFLGRKDFRKDSWISDRVGRKCQHWNNENCTTSCCCWPSGHLNYLNRAFACQPGLSIDGDSPTFGGVFCQFMLIITRCAGIATQW